MRESVHRWKVRLYDRRPGWISSATQFTQVVRNRLRLPAVLLDLGAGAGKGGLINFLADGVRVVGLDPDESISRNPTLSARVRGMAQALPFKPETFDLVFADWFVEHLEEPLGVAREVARVLKSKGFFVFQTGNLWHYSYAIAAYTPHWFHRLVANRVRGYADETPDPCPTFYRMNSLHAVRRTLLKAGFVEDTLAVVETEPSYLMFSVPTFLAGAAYERIVNSTSRLQRFRACIMGCFRRI
jgi:SAM-dependent methyltransferase